MSYTITRTNGTTLGTIADGTFDNTRTSLTLVGRNYSNYGQIMTNNLVRLLENSSYSIQPSNPLSGQLWWDSGNSLLKVYTGTVWKIVSSCTSQTGAPTTTIAGDLWWDSDDERLYVYNGTNPYSAAGWIEAGPGYPKAHKTGAILETISSSLAVEYYVLSVYADGVRTQIISKEAFTPAGILTGFANIRPGVNANTSVGSNAYYGTAENANNLGTFAASRYWRDNTNNTGTGTLSVVNDSGITVGAGNDLTLSVNGTDAQIINNTSGGNLALYTNGTGTLMRYLTITAGGNVEVAADPVSTLGIATKGYVDNRFVNANLTGISTAVTAPAGTSNTMIATTEFISSGLSGIFKYKIHDGAIGTNHLWIDSSVPGANLVIGSTLVMLATPSGMELKQTPTAPTQTQSRNGTGNLAIASTAYVKTAQQFWGTGANASAKHVSVSAPTSSDGENGDFWFQLAG
jgi:hypothetical protein